MNNCRSKNVSLIEEHKCTGCFACVNSCKHGAIKMSENIIGHFLPVVDSSLCINCGLCYDTCPSNKKIEFYSIKKVFAAWARRREEHVSSTSGGIASVLSRCIISGGGVVYACCSLPNAEIRHIRLVKEDDISLLKGSKYVQSRIDNIFQLVKKDLESNNSVLFIGTPCQVAGLNGFLRRKYLNLYTVDLVCHGVPSQKLLFDHIHYLGFSLSDVDRISFRSQRGYQLSFWKKGKQIYCADQFHDLYYSGFNDALFLRESCVNCKYAQAERVGDITLGDFHGLGTSIPFDISHEGNISMVSINTEKGEFLFSEIKSLIECYERQINEALRYNPQLNYHTARKSNYSRFLHSYEKKGYAKAAKRALLIRRFKNIILGIKSNVLCKK